MTPDEVDRTLPTNETEPDARVDQQVTAAIRALGSCSAVEQLALRMFYVEGLSVEEITKRTGIASGPFVELKRRIRQQVSAAGEDVPGTASQ